MELPSTVQNKNNNPKRGPIRSLTDGIKRVSKRFFLPSRSASVMKRGADVPSQSKVDSRTPATTTESTSQCQPTHSNPAIVKPVPATVRKTQNSQQGGDGGGGGGDRGRGSGGGGGGDGGGDGGRHSGVHVHGYGGGDGGGYDGGGYDGGGYDGCFSGDSLVHMADRSCLPIRELKKHDRIVCNPNGEIVEVVCVVAMRVENAQSRMFRLASGLQVTARHHILLPGTSDWVLPQDLPTSVAQLVYPSCSHVYNIVLSKGPSTLLINGVTCLALGHGLQGDLEHEFWGNRERVLGSLFAIDADGFERGWVEVAGTLRDGVSGRVCGYKGVRSKGT